MTNYDLSKPYIQYCEEILNFSIPSSNAVYLTCQRFKNWFDRDDIYFDYADVDKKIRFVSKMRHSTGIHNGKRFKLLPWQQFAFAGIFGWKYTSNNYRVTKNVLMFISRKNGKTALAAAIALVLATIDNEPGAEIDFVANSAQQARIGFEHTNNFAESLDPNRMLFKPYRDTIKIPHTKSKIQVLCSDSMSLDGYNSSCFIIDEMHAQKDWNLYNVMKSSQGMRTQPLAIVITTAGFLLDGYPLFEMRKTCIDILNGVKVDDSQFSLLYELDKDDSYEDEDNWIKCCPSLDQTVTREYMRDQVTTAKNIPAQETGVKTKNFNIFCQSKDVWIPDTYIKQCTAPVILEDFRGNECWVGIDLSSVSDMSSIGVMIPYEGKFYFKTYSFLPESALEESINKELYRYWKSTGELIVTEGNCIDYDFILGKLQEIHSICPINTVYFDPYNSTQFNIKCTDEGFNMIPFNQNLGNFNRGTKQMEVLLRTNKAVLDNNRINIWTFGNVVLRYDYNGNCKPDKTINENKIDPVISIVEALGGWLNDGGDLSGYDITIV